jgi:gamma-glutamyl-gamma-aminobutyrate hydrolase PuuD
MILYTAPEKGDPNDVNVGFLGKMFNEVVPILAAEDITERGSVLVLWGGTDIGTKLYDQKASAAVKVEQPSARDLNEYEMALHCIELGIPILGICRGAQMACIAAGGALYQHCLGHDGKDHDVVSSDGEVIVTNSYHHQMMDPQLTRHELLAWSRCIEGNVLMGQYLTRVKVDKHPEVVFFHDIRALGIQGHPEWMKEGSPFQSYCIEQIEKKLLS